MAVRPINAIRFEEILEQWKKDCLEDNDIQGADIISDVILQLDDMPTLTQPNEGVKDKNVPTNEPLTLEELREMDGHPVWVKQLKGLSVCDTDWAVVEFRLEPDVKHDKIRVWWPGSEDEDTPSEDDYGKTWLAYRRPLEGEA